MLQAGNATFEYCKGRKKTYIVIKTDVWLIWSANITFHFTIDVATLLYILMIKGMFLYCPPGCPSWAINANGSCNLVPGSNKEIFGLSTT